MLKPDFVALLRIFTAALPIFSMLSPSALADADAAAARGALFSQRVTCVPTLLIATDTSEKKGFALDLDKAATQLGAGSVQRAYNIPDSEVRVNFSMNFSEKKIEIAKMYTKVHGKTEKLMMTFASAWTLDLPMAAGTIYVMKGGEKGSDIPPYEVECRLERTRIDPDCPDCH